MKTSPELAEAAERFVWHGGHVGPVRNLRRNLDFANLGEPFAQLCRELGITQSFTRAYTPRTNGKTERFIQTLKRRWAYRRAYRTSAIRAASLPAWVKHHNHQRPHRALGK